VPRCYIPLKKDYYGYLWLDDIGEDNSFCSMSGIKVIKIKSEFLV
jgi:hypothetical protein